MTKVFNFFGNRKRFPAFSVRYWGGVVLLLLFSLSAFSQSVTIKGKVFENKNNSTIIGANVRVKGAPGGTITDVNGEFQLSVPALPTTLVVSSVGYKPQELDIYENEAISVYLAEDLNKLKEVVVVGYGTQARENITGSVATVNVSDLDQIPVSSFDNALQGKISGVQVTQTSGQPGAAVSIRIRGGNSIQGGNEPLYVIDGFPVYNNNDDANAGAVSGAGINALSSLNPSDIESIDVLKDANATAIYGSRGANGVVQITTKRGKAGKVQVSYESYYGTQELAKKIPLLNAQQFGQLKNDAIETANEVVRVNKSGTIRSPYYTDAQLDSLGNVSTNWEDAAFRKAAIQNHQLLVSGGDEKTRYALSGNYFKQDGILLNSNFTRYSTRLNFDRKLSENVKVGENFTLSQSSANESPSGIVNTILAVRPDFPIYNADGSYTYKQPGEAALGNPIATLTQQTNLSKIFRVLGNGFLDYNIIPGLTARVTVGVDILHNNQFRYIPSTLSEGNSIGYAYQGNKRTYTWLNENTLNYSKKLGNHSFDLLAGFTQQETERKGFIAATSGFSNDVLTYNDLGSGTTYIAPSSSSSKSQQLSYLGRVNYAYKERYLLSVTGRADGSSRFGSNNKWGYFPSVGVAWNAYKEDFLKEVKQVSNAKIRLSAGQTGNQEIGDYQSLANIATYNYVLSDKISSGYAPGRIANSDLTWETTTQYDGGIDLGFFDNFLNLTFDAYYKKTTNLLLNVSIPATAGQLTALQNYGSVENKGLEITLSTDYSKESFHWNSSLNYSLNRNKILSLGDGVSYINSYLTDGTYISKVGYAVGSYYVLKTNGVYQASDDIANLPKYKTPTLPGYRKYVDVNGDGTIGIANDRVIVGSAQPKFLASFNNSFAYSVFDLSVLFQGSYGAKLYNYTRNYLDMGTGYTNTTTALLNRWTPTNTNTDIPRAIEDPAPLASDVYIEDGSYLRLKNATFGITLPRKWVRLAKINKVRFYISGSNLVTWTKYTGFDPEGSRNEQTNTTQGYDNAVYPTSRTYLGGISITF